MTLMRARANFDFYCHHLTDARSNRDFAGMKDQATSERSLLVAITRTRCGFLLSNVLDSVRMRVVSKVITLTSRGSGLKWTDNLVAASRVQATEPQTGFHIAQSSYGTEL